MIVLLLVAQRPDIKLPIRLTVKHETLDRRAIKSGLEFVLRELIGMEVMANPA